jgi:NADH dehydrogenase FAD-containing subunit
VTRHKKASVQVLEGECTRIDPETQTIVVEGKRDKAMCMMHSLIIDIRQD